MKRIIKLFILVLIVLCPAFVNAEEYNYTLDNANVLKTKTKDYIETYSDFLYKQESFKYYVVTAQNLGMYTLDELANIYYEQLNINNQGILILYIKEEKALQIKVGEATSNVITDEIITNHINTYFLPFLKNQEVDQGILNGYKSLYKVVCNIYNIDSTEMEVYNADNFYEKYKNYIILFLIWINTTTTYLICDIIKKFYSKKKKITKKKETTFIISCAINILVIFISYFMNPTTMALILCFELVAITSSYSTSKTLDLNKIKVMEYKKELKRQEKEKKKKLKQEALRLKKLKKIQKQVRKENKKRKKTSSDLESMLNRAKHK